MENSELYKSIEQLTEKIKRLNESLQISDNLHPVELDLLKAYCTELNKVVGELTTGYINKKEEVEKEVDPAETVESPTAGLLPQEPVVEHPPQPEPSMEVHKAANPEAISKVAGGSVVGEKAGSPEQKMDDGPKEKDLTNLAEKINREMGLPDKTGEYVEPVPEQRNLKAEPKSLNERLGQEKPDLSEKLGQQPVRSMLAELDLAQKFQFAKELFNADNDLFERSLRRLNDCQDFDSAMKMLHSEIKMKFDWKGKEKFVEKLETLIQKRFGHIGSEG